MTYTININVKDDNTDVSAADGGFLNANVGDSITLTGVVYENGVPTSYTCDTCVQICTVAPAPTPSCFSTVGLGSLGNGEYLYGPVGIPDTNFGIQVKFSAPDGSMPESGVVMVTIGGSMANSYSCINGSCVPEESGGQYSTLAECQTYCLLTPPGLGNNTLLIAVVVGAIAVVGIAAYYGRKKGQTNTQ